VLATESFGPGPELDAFRDGLADAPRASGLTVYGGWMLQPTIEPTPGDVGFSAEAIEIWRANDRRLIGTAPDLGDKSFEELTRTRLPRPGNVELTLHPFFPAGRHLHPHLRNLQPTFITMCALEEGAWCAGWGTPERRSRSGRAVHLRREAVWGVTGSPNNRSQNYGSGRGLCTWDPPGAGLAARS
jgi:hypothetical protein